MNTIIVLILPFLFIAFILFFVIKTERKKRLLNALNLKLLLVRLPQKNRKEDSFSSQTENWKDEINLSSQLFSILAGLKSPFVLEAAVHHIGEDIHFYIAVPKNSISSVSRQIEGIFKDAQVEEIDDYNIFTPNGEMDGVYIKQKFSSVLPLRTYIEANVDTFAPILNGLSKINEIGEGAAIQILAKLANPSVKKNALSAISKLKRGEKVEGVSSPVSFGFKEIKNTISPKKEKEEKEKFIDEDSIKAVTQKISKPLLDVNFRVLSSAPNAILAESILDGIISGVSQFSAPFRQELKIIKPRNLQKLAFQFSFREFDNSQIMSLNTEELASLFHLPVFSTAAPKVKWAKSKELAPPENLPKSGTFLGESFFRNEKKTIYLTEEDRRRHVYVIGQTGTGKTTIMVNMALDDIKKGKGLAIIDPHGEFIDSVLGVIPKERIDDVIIFNPADLSRPIGMNMLEYDFSKPEQKTFIVNELFNIFDKLYDMKSVGGPMFEQYFKMATMLLMEDMINEPATLMEIQKVFTDDNFRERKLKRIFNSTVINFWEKEAAKATGEHSLANMSTYITSKINQFTANDFMRPIIGQEKSAFDFRKIMDEGKIFLVNLSKGRIGDLNMSLLGMVIIGKILMAALSRTDLSPELRKDFNLYIDEFQNFTTDSTSVILSEARKYRLNLTVAHQFIAQLKENIRDSVFGNVGSKIIFRVGVPDAEFIIKEFEPDLSINDLANIANLNAYAKILINGQTAKPFNIHIPFPQKSESGQIEKIKEISRLKYGKERQLVEEEIIKRFRN